MVKMPQFRDVALWYIWDVVCGSPIIKPKSQFFEYFFTGCESQKKKNNNNEFSKECMWFSICGLKKSKWK
jgi:hypothetical protein